MPVLEWLADPHMWAALLTLTAIRRALTEERGDLLVFLPGVGDIGRVQRRLEEVLELVVGGHVEEPLLPAEVHQPERGVPVPGNHLGVRPWIVRRQLIEDRTHGGPIVVGQFEIVLDADLAHQGDHRPHGAVHHPTERYGNERKEDRKAEALKNAHLRVGDTEIVLDGCDDEIENGAVEKRQETGDRDHRQRVVSTGARGIDGGGNSGGSHARFSFSWAAAWRARS